MSIAIACIAFCYLVLQDIRTLVGVAAGVSTIAFVSRLASTIYSVASATAPANDSSSRIRLRFYEKLSGHNVCENRRQC